MQGTRNRHGIDAGRRPTCLRACALALLAFLLSACAQLEKPKTEAFYAETAPPKIKEFRWSNGKLPKTFDPAIAVAPPDTDVVRAVYEGLTDTDPKTLETTPAVAEKWSASDDFKIWTFQLRKDAKWSNGEAVTAADFVRSWQRALALGDKSTHRRLFLNIVGAKVAGTPLPDPAAAPPDLLKPVDEQKLPVAPENANVAKREPKPEKTTTPKPSPEKTPEEKFGAEAVGDHTLRVTLRETDEDFPALVAHPLFRPVYGDGADLANGLSAEVVTNGAFRISAVDASGVVLDRSDTFWGRDAIEIERVRLVPQQTAEKALEAYRRGEIDAVTNIDFEPLALKLLTPYDDFKRKTHSALNFYEFNRTRKPFDDRRVREALAIAIDRERLTEIETDGSTRPALTFLPFDDEKAKRLVQDKDRAKELLADAGFDDGEDFPVVRLVINRNDVQQRIARAVVKMWKQALNIDTVIVVKENAELDQARATGDYDLLRRGVVLPTNDEAAGLDAIFAPYRHPETPDTRGILLAKPSDAADTRLRIGPSAVPPEPEPDDAPPLQMPAPEPILSEAEALREVPAIPLYFPTSYSLVKPYVQGFEINTLDAPSLKSVRIDNNWQPKKPGSES